MGATLSDPFRIFAQSNAPALPYGAENAGDYFPPFLINSNVAFFVRLAKKADQILEEGDPYVPSPRFTAKDAQTLRDGQALLVSHVQQHTPLPENTLDLFRSVHDSLHRISTFFVERMSVLHKKEEEASNRRIGLVSRLEFLHASGRYLDMVPYFPNQTNLLCAEAPSLQQSFADAGNVISLTSARVQKQNQDRLDSVFIALLDQMSRSPDWAKHAAPISTLDTEIRALQRERTSSGKIHAAIKATAERILTELLSPPANVIAFSPCQGCVRSPRDI